MCVSPPPPAFHSGFRKGRQCNGLGGREARFWGSGDLVLSSGLVRLFENSLWLSPRCFLLLALFRSRGTVLILGDSCSPCLGNIKVVTRQGQREAFAKLQEKTAQHWGAPGRGLRPRPPPSAGRAPAALAVYAEGCGKWEVGIDVIRVSSTGSGKTCFQGLPGHTVHKNMYFCEQVTSPYSSGRGYKL